MAKGRAKPMQGFTMIEVLVALLILAIGLLGVAGLQGLALKSVGDSERRAIAHNLAVSLAERIRANGNNDLFYAVGSLTECAGKGDFTDWCAQVARELPEGNVSTDIVDNNFVISLSWVERLGGSKYAGEADSDGADLERFTYVYEMRAAL